MKKILLYLDRGVDGAAARFTYRSLKMEVDPSVYAIQRVDHTYLVSKEWETDTTLLVIPGGQDVQYDQLLGGAANRRISAFVKEGGSYFGICAGGYYGCGAIEFEKGHPNEICIDRELAFFPGLAAGPAYGPNLWEPHTRRGVRASAVRWGNQLAHVYFNGGCSFVDPERHPSVSVLARYADLPGQPAAIVDCTVGCGRAILSGVHLEFSADLMDATDTYVQPYLPFFIASEPMRKEWFATILQKLLAKRA